MRLLKIGSAVSLTGDVCVTGGDVVAAPVACTVVVVVAPLTVVVVAL